jgi:hypothetical protein
MTFYLGEFDHDSRFILLSVNFETFVFVIIHPLLRILDSGGLKTVLALKIRLILANPRTMRYLQVQKCPGHTIRDFNIL